MKEYISLKELDALATLCTHAVRELTEDDFFVFFEKYLMEQENFNTDIYDISRDMQCNKEQLKSIITITERSNND